MQVQRTQQNQWFLAFQVSAIPCYQCASFEIALVNSRFSRRELFYYSCVSLADRLLFLVISVMCIFALKSAFQ
jgi:hypothetical protein